VPPKPNEFDKHDIDLALERHIGTRSIAVFLPRIVEVDRRGANIVAESPKCLKIASMAPAAQRRCPGEDWSRTSKPRNRIASSRRRAPRLRTRRRLSRCKCA